jgi:transposase InsO family protein
MCSRHFLAWCIERKIDAVHIQPGKPTQNAHVESFHGRLRDEMTIAGAGNESRTRDLLITSQPLCQLSYPGSRHH